MKHFGTESQTLMNIDSSLSQDGNIDNDVCLQCHAIEKRSVTPKSGFSKKMGGEGSSKYHAKHLDRKILCVTCHNRVAHEGAENFLAKGANNKGKSYKNNMKMEGCVRCHPLNEKVATLAHKYPGAPKDCETCHEKEKSNQAPQFHLDAGARWLKPAKAPGIGKGSASERAVHSREAKKRGKDFCFTCHDWDSFCNKCHNEIYMPHKMDTWKKPKNEHVKIGANNETACLRCHPKQRSESLCVPCHHKKFYDEMPSLSDSWATKEGGMAYVKKKGAYPCWQCHDQEFCSYCHTNNKKPPYLNFEKKIKGSKG